MASIKPNKSGSAAIGGSGISASGRVNLQNVSLADLIGSAFAVPSDQLVGGPDWLSSERFDIEARPASPVGSARVQIMLQQLLKERFKLAYHRETRDVPMYQLSVAKDGHRLKSTTEARGFKAMQRGHLVADGVSLDVLIRMLERLAGC